MRISDWSSDVCSSDLMVPPVQVPREIYVNGLEGTSRCGRQNKRPVAIAQVDTPVPTPLAAGCGILRHDDLLPYLGCLETNMRFQGKRTQTEIVNVKMWIRYTALGGFTGWALFEGARSDEYLSRLT